MSRGLVTARTGRLAGWCQCHRRVKLRSRHQSGRGDARVFTNSGTMYPGALAPGTQVGRWRVVERLGVGGQGAVYRVEDMEHILMKESDGQPVLLDFGVGWYEGAHPLTTGPLP